ncbi:hypothetical protein FPSE_00277 [Fusarium pseudograminearum CS3096]|uniref:Uncharacterized protein n=1 Tax=Fusarium pseudograminearum (strain CS3096) TaxID=1028729 RepID=K3VUK9_FUSPC|nr:hypothetical protein FPSE_00277 [Fusarium pseudograminearum CS3096]EKJ79592.1 hypothetical protein FPSE_00277 [Fusarium pseudograminearum CS3096]
MDPERPYPSIYGYYYNTPTHPAPGTGYRSNPRQDNPFLPCSSAGGSAGLDPTQEYGEGEDFSSRPAESYDSNLRPDNPFLPQQSHAGGSVSFHLTQEYGGRGDVQSRPAQSYDSNLRPDNPFLPQQTRAGGSAQFNSTQGYGQYSEPSYSPAQGYSQRSEYDPMGRLQSRFQQETSDPRPETARVYR